MRYPKLFLAILVMLVLVSADSQAWDKQRKGFIISLGAGAGLMDYDYGIYYMEGALKKTKLAFASNFEIGYAPSNQIIIAYTSLAHVFARTGMFDEDEVVIGGVMGPSLTYFLNESEPSLFLGAGIGLARWSEAFDENAHGFGFFMKFGYEFSRNANLCLHFISGSTKDKEGSMTLFKSDIMGFGVTINWMGY